MGRLKPPRRVPPLLVQRLAPFVPMWYVLHAPGCPAGAWRARAARAYAEKAKAA